MGLYNVKTTRTMPLLCSDPDSVDGETSGFGTASNLWGVSQRKAYSDIMNTHESICDVLHSQHWSQ